MPGLAEAGPIGPPERRPVAGLFTLGLRSSVGWCCCVPGGPARARRRWVELLLGMLDGVGGPRHGVHVFQYV